MRGWAVRQRQLARADGQTAAPQRFPGYDSSLLRKHRGIIVTWNDVSFGIGENPGGEFTRP